MGHLPALWAHLVPPVPAVPLDVPDDAAFEAHARALTRRNMQVTALFILAAAAASWAADGLVYHEAPEIAARLFWMRASHVATALVFYLALRLRLVDRRVALVALVAMGIACVAIGRATSELGDLTTPWFHFNYAAALGIVVPVVALRMRIVYGATFVTLLAAGFLSVRPELPRPPMLIPTVAFLLFVTLTGVTLGHGGYRVIRRGFASDRAQQRGARALAELNATLEQRVRAQTHELRLLADHLERAREDERTRIARELHDELGQELTALRYCLTFLRKRFEKDPASIRGNLDELESLLGRTAGTTRQILSDLRPRILDDLGLDAGVEWLLKRTEERAGLACRLVTSCRKLDVDVDVSIAAFRILQESLTNVVKHAQATHVDVEVSVEGGELCMTIRDDGVGLPEGRPSKVPPPAPGKGGMGLIGMRERVDALGGTLRLESTPGTGTTIRVRLPTSVRRATPPPDEVSLSS